MYDQVIKLVDEDMTADEFGDIQIEETEREVFAELRSITQSEFYQAQAAGLKPEIKFLLADYLDYRNELTVRYQPFESEKELEYAVLRTYRTGNGLELICKRGVDRDAGT